MPICDPIDYSMVHAAVHAVSEGWCPSPSPGACSNSCPYSWWCHPTISSSVIPFSFCTQSFPASGFFSQWVSSSHQIAKALELQLRHKSFQGIFRVDFLNRVDTWWLNYPFSTLCIFQYLTKSAEASWAPLGELIRWDDDDFTKSGYSDLFLVKQQFVEYDFSGRCSHICVTLVLLIHCQLACC